MFIFYCLNIRTNIYGFDYLFENKFYQPSNMGKTDVYYDTSGREQLKMKMSPFRHTSRDVLDRCKPLNSFSLRWFSFQIVSLSFLALVFFSHKCSM